MHSKRYVSSGRTRGLTMRLNCGRIHLPNRNNIHLSAMDDEEFKQFCELLESLVKPALEVARLRKRRNKASITLLKKNMTISM